MTKMERRRGAKRGSELTERRKEIAGKDETQELQISVYNKPKISGSSSKPILCPHASNLGIKSVDNYPNKTSGTDLLRIGSTAP